MRRHGWGGDIPEDDEAAIARIVAAAQRLLRERPDEVPSIAEVAERVSVSRQTIYRYFSSSHALLVAAVTDGINDFLDAIADHLGHIASAPEAVVEGIAYTYEQIPRRPDLALLLSSRGGAAHEITSPTALALARSIVERLSVDWRTTSFKGEDLNELVELMLRTLQSFVVDPGDPERTPEQLRAYLHRWIGPSVAARAAVLG
jgi:AcrR family transcriptional regulator